MRQQHWFSANKGSDRVFVEVRDLTAFVQASGDVGLILHLPEGGYSSCRKSELSNLQLVEEPNLRT